MPITNMAQAREAAEFIKSGKITDQETLDALMGEIANFQDNLGGLDTDITPYTPTKKMAGSPKERYEMGYSDAENALAAQGVDINTGVPSGLRNRLSLALNEEQKMLQLKGYFQSKGKSTNVRKNEQGQLEYYNPDTKRYTLVEPVTGINTSVGGAMDFTGQLVGGGVGTALGMASAAPMAVTPFTSAAGVSVGQALSEAGKAAIGKFLGVNETMPTKEEASIRGRNVAEAAAWDIAGQATFGAGKGIGKWAWSGLKPLTKQQAMDIQALQKAYTVVEDYNKRFPDNPINMNALQAAYEAASPAEKQVLAGVWSEYQSAIRVDPTTSAALRAQQEGSINAVQESYKRVTGRFLPRGADPEDPNIGNREFSDEARQLQSEELGKRESALGRMERRAGLLVNNTAAPNQTGTPYEMGRQIADRVGAVEEKQEAVVRTAYNELYDALGVAPAARSLDRGVRANYNPADNDINRVIDSRLEMDEQTTRELNNLIDGWYHTNVDDGEFLSRLSAVPDTLLKKDRKAASKNAIGNPRGVPSPTRLDPSITYLDAQQVIAEMQARRAGVRKVVGDGSKAVTINADAALAVNDVLERNLLRQWRDRGRIDLVDKYEIAKQARMDKDAMFNDTALQGILARRKSGDPNIDYATWIDVFQKKDGLAARQLKEILKGDPQAVQDMKDIVLAIYRRDYTENGIPTAELSSKFKKDYEVAINNFFGPKEGKLMLAYDSAAKHVLQSRQRLENFNKEWKESWIGKFVKKPNSEEVTNYILRPSKSISPVEAEQLNVMLSRNPDLQGKVRYSLARAISRKTTVNGTPNPADVDKLISEHGAILRKIMPLEYMNDLKLLAATFRSVAEPATANLPINQKIPLMKFFVRSFIRPMSQEGLIQTAGFQFRKAARARMWQNAISDPDKLRLYIHNINKDARTVAGAGVLTSLNAEAIYDE